MPLSTSGTDGNLQLTLQILELRYRFHEAPLKFQLRRRKLVGALGNHFVDDQTSTTIGKAPLLSIAQTPREVTLAHGRS